jgi:hypothetical protein
MKISKLINYSTNMYLSCWVWQNDNHFGKLLGQKMVDAIKHFLFLGFPMAISHKLFWFIVFPKSFFGSLHSQWPFPVQGTAMVNTPRNSNWEQSEPKRLPLTVEIFFFCILSSIGGLLGLVGWEKKPAYNQSLVTHVHPGNGHFNTGATPTTYILQNSNMRTKNHSHPPCSVQVSSQPGCHFALAS